MVTGAVVEGGLHDGDFFDEHPIAHAADLEIAPPVTADDLGTRHVRVVGREATFRLPPLPATADEDEDGADFVEPLEITIQ